MFTTQILTKPVVWYKELEDDYELIALSCLAYKT